MRHAIMTHTYMPDRLHDALRRIMISRFSMGISTTRKLVAEMLSVKRGFPETDTDAGIER